MTKYRVRAGKMYVKYTCRFGAFHGSIVLTKKKSEARIWTREKDAARCAWVANWRVSSEGYKNDAEKFAGLTFEVICD